MVQHLILLLLKMISLANHTTNMHSTLRYICILFDSLVFLIHLYRHLNNLLLFAVVLTVAEKCNKFGLTRILAVAQWIPNVDTWLSSQICTIFMGLGRPMVGIVIGLNLTEICTIGTFVSMQALPQDQMHKELFWAFRNLIICLPEGAP